MDIPPGFEDKGREPTEEDLTRALGRSATHWKRLLANFGETYPPLTVRWRFFSAKSGWICQTMRKKRTIFWLSPKKKHFTAGTIFGEKAVAAARMSDLPPPVLELIKKAEKFPEGRAVRLEVRVRKDADVVEMLAAIKMAH